MKEYSISKSFSISISQLDNIIEVIKGINSKKRITHIIETGTYLGTGSTKIIAKAIINNKPDVFITMEANWRSWRRARINLAKFEFVKPLWGKSVATAEAINFIENDDTIKNHSMYENIYIDGGKDPITFYKNEILGNFGYSRLKYINKIYKFIENRNLAKYYSGEDLLKTYLEKYKDNEPLIVLDSCGGIGFLEFTIVENIMSDSNYYILLDDINHLKHFRSYKRIQATKEFEILSINKDCGWLLAKKVIGKVNRI